MLLGNVGVAEPFSVGVAEAVFLGVVKLFPLLLWLPLALWLRLDVAKASSMGAAQEAVWLTEGLCECG